MKAFFCRAAAGVSLVLLGAACGQSAVTTPRGASSAEAGAALARAHGLTVRANAMGWMGTKRVTRELTPVHVSLVNQSEVAVELAFEQMVLTGGDRRVAAIAPKDVRLRKQRAQIGVDPLTRARADLYPPDETASRLGHKKKSREVVEYGVHSGLLPAGQIAEGFLYFEKLPAEVATLTLTIGFTEATPDRTVHTLSVSFQAP